jgi:hypothetical protein
MTEFDPAFEAQPPVRIVAWLGDTKEVTDTVVVPRNTADRFVQRLGWQSAVG